MLGRGLAALAIVATFAGGVIFVFEGGKAAALSEGPPVADAAPDPAVTMGKSGLPLPRFVSLKAGRVNVRVGPGEDYKVAWVFTKSQLPVEVIQEFDTWRRIRDSDGQMGWVFHSLLSAKRTAVVTPCVYPGEVVD
jgi:SH3-like domain-containing protein